MSKIPVYIRLVREGASFAIQALVVNRLRSVLSLLSIVIGIFLIISIFTLVTSLEKNIRLSFSSLGDDAIFVEKMPWGPEEDGEYAWWEYAQRPNVTFRDWQQLKERVQSASAITFFASARRTLENGANTAENSSVVAITEGFENFISVDIQSGRYFSHAELGSSRRVCVLGYDVAERLFGRQDATGRIIKLAGFKTTVIGVLEKAGASVVGSGTDEWVLIPIDFGRMVMPIDLVHTQLGVKPKEGVGVVELENDLTMHMRSIRTLRPGEDKNFSLNKTSMISGRMDELFAFLNLAGLIIGGFSILVGGFSIANIMFVTVRERTPIIGIQKALGAKRNFILFQFLFESVLLCVLGGVIGLVLIFAATKVATWVTGFDFVLTPLNILIGIGFSVGIGLVSGVVPAYTAARLEPAEAMRATV